MAKRKAGLNNWKKLTLIEGKAIEKLYQLNETKTKKPTINLII